MWTPLAAAAALLAAASIASTAVGHQHQTPLQLNAVELQNQPIVPPRKLYGRFLHITDLHPDSHYKHGTDPDKRCHRGKGDAGHWGAENSSCDAPWTLVNETFRWIDENLRDKIDFVIWTGDSARHDNDNKIPRTSHEIYDLNTKVVNKMVEVFGDSSDPENPLVVPIVPTLGNNDIYPHNIMQPGPSKLTKEYVEIWKPFIPETQFHTFHKGAYFWQQVVPGRNGAIGPGSEGGLAVFSLNTLYFFDSNKAVDGCDLTSEPGYEQMEWLNVQLALIRERGMKAILIGHVPPAWTKTKMNWYPSCWKKYVRWSRQYRDVIVGHIYGHMNLDHFMLLDSDGKNPPLLKKPKKKKKKKGTNGKKKGKSYKIDIIADDSGLLGGSDDMCSLEEFNPETDPVVSLSSAEVYLNSLRNSFENMLSPKGVDRNGVDYSKHLGGKWAERYVLAHVSPSVIPNYFPTLRVMEYNITGLVDMEGALIVDPDVAPQKKKKKSHKNKVTNPDPPEKTTPPGPAYSVQPYTFMSYTQYFLNLTKYNDLARRESESASSSHVYGELKKREEDPGMQKSKIQYEVEYDTRTDNIYKLKDLTVRSYVRLAQDIVDASSRNGKAKTRVDSTDLQDEDEEFLDDDNEHVIEGDVDAEKKKKKKKKRRHGRKKNKARDRVWHAFVDRAFVGTIDAEELEEYKTECS